MKASSSIENFFWAVEMLVRRIVDSRLEVERILTAYEPLDTFIDEYERSLNTLRGLRKEFSPYNNFPTGLKITAFFPLNLPLYSLILFGIAPYVFSGSGKLVIRCPEVMSGTLNQLVGALRLTELFPSLSVVSVSRDSFVNNYAKTADVVLFTGKYENAVKVQGHCRKALFIYNGGGINPVVVFNDADLNLATAKVVEMRLYNNGQDCAGSDAIFVDNLVADRFISGLLGRIAHVKDRATDPRAFVLNRRRYIEELAPWLKRERENIVRKGRISKKRGVVEPVVVCKPLRKHAGPFFEFFAPVFYVLRFSDPLELKRAFNSKWLRDHNMYTTLFGWDEVALDFCDSIILRNVIVNDVEQGNLPYGGYGKKANFVAFGDKKKSYPILISREIVEFFSNRS